MCECANLLEGNLISNFKLRFDKIYSDVKNDIIGPYKHSILKDASLWFEKVLDYNLPDGKKNRGLCVVNSYIILKNNLNLKQIEIDRIIVLGWCVEMLQAYFLIDDDIMDQSMTRRGRLCWYKNENVGNIAINDGLFIQSSIFTIIRKHFKTDSNYLTLLEIFLEIDNKTILGQCLDTITSSPSSSASKSFSQFTIERYTTIIKYKTIYYSFYLPVFLALIMTNLYTKENIEYSKQILYIMGYYFQVQDDYLDCFGDPEITGKIGTDIEDFKCSWLIVNALKMANPQQLEILEANYGKRDGSCVRKVKDVYNELKLKETFGKFEEAYLDIIKHLIDDYDHCDKAKSQAYLSRYKELFPGDSSEIVDNVFTFPPPINGDGNKANLEVGKDETHSINIPKSVFWYYHDMIYKRVK